MSARACMYVRAPVRAREWTVRVSRRHRLLTIVQPSNTSPRQQRAAPHFHPVDRLSRWPAARRDHLASANHGVDVAVLVPRSQAQGEPHPERSTFEQRTLPAVAATIAAGPITVIAAIAAAIAAAVAASATAVPPFATTTTAFEEHGAGSRSG